jgi:hypothetical protein
MHGQVLEIACDRPDLAMPVLRRLAGLDEVALYGAQIHVVSVHPDRQQPLIQEALRQVGVTVSAIDRIAPSLEDVFIASARSGEQPDR